MEGSLRRPLRNVFVRVRSARNRRSGLVTLMIEAPMSSAASSSRAASACGIIAPHAAITTREPTPPVSASARR